LPIVEAGTDNHANQGPDEPGEEAKAVGLFDDSALLVGGGLESVFAEPGGKGLQLASLGIVAEGKRVLLTVD
jgi:hypothetical protein